MIRNGTAARRAYTGRAIRRGALCAASVWAVAPTTAALAAASGTWMATAAPMLIGRFAHTATLLGGPGCAGSPTPAYCGKILVAGGADVVHDALADAELYDPATGLWSPTGPMATARWGHTATQLADGRVLVTGGMTGANVPFLLPTLQSSRVTVPTTATEIYDPASGFWTATGSMAAARYQHTATLLSGPACSGASPPAYCGEVLVAGGDSGGAAELYSPVTGTFTATGALTAGRSAAGATLLGGAACTGATPPPYCGRVLLTGGYNTSSLAAYGSTELYDPAAGAWRTAGVAPCAATPSSSCPGPLGTARFAFGVAQLTGSGCSVRHPPSYCGKVLAAGGGGSFSFSTPPVNALSSAELYDPAAGSWSGTGAMGAARFQLTASRLSAAVCSAGAPPAFCGRVLAAGGDAAGSAELYDPASATWSSTGSMTSVRYFHTATVRDDGTVLVAGGATQQVTDSCFQCAGASSAEVYTP